MIKALVVNLGDRTFKIFTAQPLIFTVVPTYVLPLLNS